MAARHRSQEHHRPVADPGMPSPVDAEGHEYSAFANSSSLLPAEPFRSFIHPDAPEFVPSGNMPERIRDYCRRTGQPVPESVGAVVRCIDESLAMRYHQAAVELEECLDRTYPRLHMIGGGIQSQLLCQMTADACGKEVRLYFAEATVSGILPLQPLSVGAIESLREARRIIRDSESIQAYQPQEAERWQEEYQRWEAVTSC